MSLGQWGFIMKKYEILGHCNNTLSIMLETIYKNEKGIVLVDIIYRYEELFDVKCGNPFNPCAGNILCTEFLAEKWVKEKGSFKILAHMDTLSRQEGFEYFLEKHGVEECHYTELFSSMANIASSVHVGNGCYVDAGSVLAPFSEIGNLTFVSRNVSVGHHTKIGKFSTLNPGCNIGGCCIINEGVTVGIGATILDNIRVGKNAVIGAGSVVTKHVDPNTVVYGVPARFIRTK